MKVGVIVDGQAESQALKSLLPKIKTPGTQLMAPAYADMQPKASPGQIARAALEKLRVLHARGAERFIVLLDAESADRCPPRLAGDIKGAFAKLDWVNVDVVVKKSRFENWLIADLAALRGMRARFKVTQRFARTVSPNKADNVPDAEAKLKTLCKGSAYHKRTDPVAIAKHQEPRRIDENSRSFRRFVRVVGCKKYANQSRRP